MKVKAIVLVAAALLCGSAAFAQQKENRDADGKFVYGPYETNRFIDNWFVTAGAGINYCNDGFLYDEHPVDGWGLGARAAIGKWCTPTVGFEIGYTGVKGSISGGFHQTYLLHYPHASFLLNFSNLVAGYRSDRFCDVIPYFNAGYALLDKCRRYGVAGGVGLRANLRLCNRVYLVPDIMCFLYPDMRGEFRGVMGTISGTLGITVDLGKNTFTRKSESMAAAAAALAAAIAAENASTLAKEQAEAAAKSAQAEKDALAAENAQLKDAIAKDAEANKAVVDNLYKTPCQVYFAADKATLSKTELAHFDYMVKTAISQGKDAHFTVNGNADSKTGTKAYNKALSERRANYIQKLLTEKYGLDPDKFEVKANGGIDIFPSIAENRSVVIERK